jgi:hypothetical protein
LAQELDKKTRIIHKYAWGFKEYENEKIRLLNDKKLKELGYKFETFSGSDSVSPNSTLKRLVQDIKDKDSLSLLIDVSAMSRTWYGAIIQALAQIQNDCAIRSIFAYCPACWKEERSTFPPNEILAPLPGYSSHELPNKPTALVIGLGQEEGRALGLKEHLDPELCICFYTKPSIDDRYAESVFTINQDLLENMDQNCIYSYNIFDTFGTYRIMESVCNGLMKNYRVVMASLGPKIFGIYCLLLATTNPAISVWRVSPASKQKPVDQKPAKNNIFFTVDWK